MKKILITGAKGMLGQELVRIFGADENYRVFGWDREEIDITDEQQVREKVLVLAPEVIVNCAAYNAVDRCEESGEFEKAKELNGEAPSFLARIAKDIKIPPNPPLGKGGNSGDGVIFVHYSTDYVFNGQNVAGYKEDDAPSPINNYGKTKLMGEQAVQDIGGKYYIIRLQKLFGKPGLGEGAKKSFFETMLALAQAKKEFDVVDEELANFTYAPDLAERTKYLIENDLRYGIYHIINEGRPVTWFGAAKILFDLFGKKDIILKPVSADRFPRPAKRPKYSVLLNTKQPPLRPWDEALKEYLGK